MTGNISLYIQGDEGRSDDDAVSPETIDTHLYSG